MKELAKAMVDIGEMVGRKTVAVISNMNEPLGFAIGNALEVKEAVATLQGNGPKDFETVCVELAAQMLSLAGKGSVEELKEELHRRLQNGVAFAKFKEFVSAQDGDVAVIDNLDLLPSAEIVEPVYAKQSGYINKIEAEKLGIASMLLGGGRAKKTDTIDYGVGIILNKKVADFVNVGDKIADLYVNDKTKLADAMKLIDEAFSYQEDSLEKDALIADIIRA